MTECLGIFKTNQTLYFDYDMDYWVDFKPDGKYTQDYTLVRRGTVLKAYKLEENDYYSIELTSGKHTLYFEDLEDAKKIGWLEEIGGLENGK